MCYATIALSTDYDSFKEVAVTAEEVVHTMKSNVVKAQQLLEKAILQIDGNAHCSFHDAMKHAVM
jgi:purine nucleoside phosphorylase